MWEKSQDFVSVDGVEIGSLKFPVFKPLNSFWFEVFPNKKSFVICKDIPIPHSAWPYEIESL